MNLDLFLTALGETTGGTVKRNEPLSRHTSWKIGGPADVLILPRDESDLKIVLSLCRRFGVPWWVMGNGSNLLVKDGGIRGVVIKMSGYFTDCLIQGDRVEAGSGVFLPHLAHETARQGLSGVEWCAGIPATIGGATVMNAGAGTHAVGDFVQWVRVADSDGHVRLVKKKELSFGYRFSSLQNAGGILTGVCLELSKDDPEECLNRLRSHLEKRRASQPMDYPSAGSVFKNPSGDFAGRLLEAVGLKGMRAGGAQVSDKHANFIINLGGAEAKDVLYLIEKMRNRVEQVFGIYLETEVRIVGEER